MKHRSKLLYLACAVALAGCGGGEDGSGSGGGPATTVQQYPSGIWTGSVGLSGGGPSIVAWIDGGSQGTGGRYFMAKQASSGDGFDALYGSLSATKTGSVTSTGGVYFSTSDSKFSSLPVTISGSITGAANDATKGADARISASYSDPSDTAAKYGSLVPFSLNFSPSLSRHPSSLALIQGIYSGGAAFGPSWTITVDSEGVLTGTNANCTLAGKFTPAPSTATNSGVYSVFMSLSGSTTSGCGAPNTTQSGVAVLQYDVNDKKTGIWIFTTQQTGNKNTFVLNGTPSTNTSALPDEATTTQKPAGIWAGTDTSGTPVSGLVTGDGSFFFYKKASNGYDFLTGALSVKNGSSRFSNSGDVLYYTSANENSSNTSTPAYTTGGIPFSGDVNNTSRKLIGIYTPPPTAATPTPAASTFTTTLITDRDVSPALLAGTYSSTAGVGGTSISLTVKNDGTYTGTTSQSLKCALAGTLVPATTSTLKNLFIADLRFTELPSATTPACTRSGEAAQTGYAYADFNAAGDAITGLRLLLVSSSTALPRPNTVFIGAKQP